MLCAACGEATPDDGPGAPCVHCGADPRLDGRYALLEVVGRGAVATTYRATDTDGARVAVKEAILRPGDATKVRQLVDREAQVLRQLDHPQIPTYIEALHVRAGRATHLFLVVDWIDGADLQARLANHRYDEREVLELLRELCEVLAHLHGRSPPIIHRDVKPANVVRRPDGTHVLVDFGSVRDALEAGELGGSTVAGTFGFMAPEQFAGDATARTDLYGLGALAIALLTRQDPSTLQAPDRTLTWRDHATVRPPVAAFLDRLLALDPAERPPSAQAVMVAIDALLVPTAPPTLGVAAAAPTPAVVAPPRPLAAAQRPPIDEPEPFHQPPAPTHAASPRASDGERTPDVDDGWTAVGLVAATVVVLVTTAAVTGAVVLAALS